MFGRRAVGGLGAISDKHGYELRDVLWELRMCGKLADPKPIFAFSVGIDNSDNTYAPDIAPS
jgi:hypothetical protein